MQEAEREEICILLTENPLELLFEIEIEEEDSFRLLLISMWLDEEIMLAEIIFDVHIPKAEIGMVR